MASVLPKNLMCQQCKLPFNAATKKPVSLLCGDTLCDTCYDQSLINEGQQIKCPFDGEISRAQADKEYRVYDDMLLKKLQQMQSSKQGAEISIPIMCDAHRDEYANYYDGQTLVCEKCRQTNNIVNTTFLGQKEYRELCDAMNARLEEFLLELQPLRSKIGFCRKQDKSMTSSEFIKFQNCLYIIVIYSCQISSVLKPTHELFIRNQLSCPLLDAYCKQQNQPKNEEVKQIPQQIQTSLKQSQEEALIQSLQCEITQYKEKCNDLNREILLLNEKLQTIPPVQVSPVKIIKATSMIQQNPYIDLKAQLAHYESKEKELNKEIESLKIQNKSQLQMLQDYDTKCQEGEAHNAALGAQLQEVQQFSERAERGIKERDSKLRELNQRLLKQENEIKYYQFNKEFSGILRQ